MRGMPLPPVDESRLLDYVLAGNGVFARGRRPGLEVCMPVSFTLQPLRGLADVTSYAQWGYPKVPLGVVEKMLAVSRDACSPTPREALFHLSFKPALFDCHSTLLAGGDGWVLEYPEQHATHETVRALSTGFGSSTERAVIEMHSHHEMHPEFSATDNEDESQGFRVYAVIGNIFSKPSIRARVGLFGHFWNYSAAEFFELPVGLNDCVAS